MEIEDLRLTVSRLENRLQEINGPASQAMRERREMEVWFARNPGHPARVTTMLDLAQKEQAALTEFVYVQRQLVAARARLDAQFEPSL